MLMIIPKIVRGLELNLTNNQTMLQKSEVRK